MTLFISETDEATPDTAKKNSTFVYFVHSFYVPVCEFTSAVTEYIVPFSAALHKDNFYTTQFHPEKSGAVGEQILRGFLNIENHL